MRRPSVGGDLGELDDLPPLDRTIRQWLTISSTASCRISPSRPCTLASAASMSRYFRVRFSSGHTWRIASLLKMPWKMIESMRVEAMVGAVGDEG